MRNYKNKLLSTQQAVDRWGYISRPESMIGGLYVENLVEELNQIEYMSEWTNYWEILLCGEEQIAQQSRIELSTCKLLDGHPSSWGMGGWDSSTVIGNLENLISKDTSFFIDFGITEKGDRAAEITAKIDDGLIIPTSIGYRAIKGRITHIDKEHQQPVIEISQWHMYHVALVSQPADESTTLGKIKIYNGVVPHGFDYLRRQYG